MINPLHLKNISIQIKALLDDEHFTPMQTELIRQKYLSPKKQVDIRRTSRDFHKPMKIVKRELEKADRKLYNLLKVETQFSDSAAQLNQSVKILNTP